MPFKMSNSAKSQHIYLQGSGSLRGPYQSEGRGNCIRSDRCRSQILRGYWDDGADGAVQGSPFLCHNFISLLLFSRSSIAFGSVLPVYPVSS